MKLPHIGSNFKRIWPPCEVKSVPANWWDRFWRAGIEHESLNAKLPDKRNIGRRPSAYDAQISAGGQVPEGKKSSICFLHWHGMLHLHDGYTPLERSLDILMLDVRSSRPVTSVTVRIAWSLFINQSNMLSLGMIFSWQFRTVGRRWMFFTFWMHHA